MNLIRIAFVMLFLNFAQGLSAETMASLLADIPKETTAGELIPVSLQVKNVSSSELIFEYGNGIRSFEFAVEEILSNGSTKPLVETNANHPPSFGSVQFIRLYPQAVKASRLDLSRLFDFTYPGKFRVKTTTKLSSYEMDEKGKTSLHEFSIQSEPSILIVNANGFTESVNFSTTPIQKNGGVGLSIGVNSHNIKQGNGIILTIVIKNSGMRQATFMGLESFQNFIYRVTTCGDLKGELLSSDIIATKSRFFLNYQSKYDNHLVLLSSGESISIQVPLNLCFDMHNSETYFIQVFKNQEALENQAAIQLVSNVINVRMCDTENEVKLKDEEDLNAKVRK